MSSVSRRGFLAGGAATAGGVLLPATASAKKKRAPKKWKCAACSRNGSRFF